MSMVFSPPCWTRPTCPTSCGHRATRLPVFTRFTNPVHVLGVLDGPFPPHPVPSGDRLRQARHGAWRPLGVTCARVVGVPGHEPSDGPSHPLLVTRLHVPASLVGHRLSPPGDLGLLLPALGEDPHHPGPGAV